MIRARRIASLDLAAASGLVVVGECLWVIADDLRALHRYGLSGKLLERVPLTGGDALEAEMPLPKAVKPDLEALVLLPDGALLALGSGSSPRRRRGYRCEAARGVVAIDLSPLYEALAAELPAPNIEGAVVHGGALLLAHRGSGGRASALITLDLPRVLTDLGLAHLSAGSLIAIRAIELGTLDGVTLGVTDLASHPDGSLWFSAAAEAADDAYQDGAIHGSAIGCIDAGGAVSRLETIAPVLKIEGLHWCASAQRRDGWLAVTDADDPLRRALLLELPAPG